MKKIVTTLAIVTFMFSMMAIANAGHAPQPKHYCVTAAKANEMVQDGAILIDCRTLEEYYWVGNPADEGGISIAYNIPYKLWTSVIDCQAGNPSLVPVERLFHFIISETFHKNTRLILMCRSGVRSSDALTYLYSKGYKNVYEIDNYLKEGTTGGPGGRGGFQGSGSDRSSDSYKGYRGWPDRNGDISTIQDPNWVPTLKSQSVSWMDTGLPVTQKLDCNLIFTITP